MNDPIHLTSSLLGTLLAAAGAATPSSAPVAEPVPWYIQVIQSPFVLIGIVFLLSTLLFGNKGKRKDEKARTDMLKNLKRGDRVQTIGGVLGAVVRAETDRVEVKVDESNNVKIWFARAAISKVVGDAVENTGKN